MSEINNSTLVTPPSQDFDTLSYRGSMQQILQENLGSDVIIEFLIGTGNLESRQGILYNVGSQFVVLYDDINLRYVVCDIFSIKFVTKEGKLLFFPQAYSCGAGRMDMSKERMRGIQPCDCKGNPEMHIYPVNINSIVGYNGRKVVLTIPTDNNGDSF